MTLPRLSPVVVNPGAVRASSTPGWELGMVPYTGSYFPSFSLFRRENCWWELGENLEHPYGTIQTAAAQRANQRKADLVNISYIYPIDWLSNPAGINSLIQWAGLRDHRIYSTDSFSSHHCSITNTPNQSLELCNFSFILAPF